MAVALGHCSSANCRQITARMVAGESGIPLGIPGGVCGPHLYDAREEDAAACTSGFIVRRGTNERISEHGGRGGEGGRSRAESSSPAPEQDWKGLELDLID